MRRHIVPTGRYLAILAAAAAELERDRQHPSVDDALAAAAYRQARVEWLDHLRAEGGLKAHLMRPDEERITPDGG